MPLQNPPVMPAMLATGFNSIRTSGMQYSGATGAKAISPYAGSAFLTKSTAGTDYTLAAPISGLGINGGDDGTELTIITTTAAAHVVTVGAGLINGATNGKATFTAAIGNSVTLVASGGVWYVKALNGVTIS